MIITTIVLCAFLFIVPSYFIGHLQGFKKAKEIDNQIIEELLSKYNMKDTVRREYMNNTYEEERLAYFKEQKAAYQKRVDMAMKISDHLDIVDKYGKKYGYYSDIVKMLEEQMKNTRKVKPMRLFECNHTWVIDQISNVIQQDFMGYPLRLVVCKCSKCGKSDQQWIDVSESELEELKSGKSVLLTWR